MEVGHSPDLVGLASEAQKLIRAKKDLKIDGRDVALLLAYANKDGRITQQERAFIQSLTVKKNAELVASPDFNAATLTVSGSTVTLKPGNGSKPLSLIDQSANLLQAKVDAKQIHTWKQDGNVSALLDVLLDPATPTDHKNLVRQALIGSAEGRWALSQPGVAEGQLAAVYGLLTSGPLEERASAWAFLQKVAGQGGETGKLASEYAQKAASEVKQAARLPLADDMVFKHKQAEFALRVDELTLRDQAHGVLFSKRSAHERVREVPALAAAFKAQSDKIDQAISAVDKDIQALEAEAKGAASPDKEQLEARVTQLKGKREQLFKDRSSLAVVQVNAAIACSRAESFPGYVVGMMGGARKSFLEQAKTGLESAKGDLAPTEFTSLDRGLTQATAVFQHKLAESRIVASERLQMLTGLRAEIAELAKLIDDEGLLKGAVKKDPAALKRLDEIRGRMINAIEQLAQEKPPGLLRKKGGANDICDALLLVADQLAAYEFDNTDGITNFNQQVMAKMFKTAVDAKFQDIQAKQDNPKAEVEVALGISQTVNSAIGDVNLVAVKKAAAQDDILDTWTTGAGMSAVELVRDADFLLENPGAPPDKWKKDHGKLVESLTAARGRFVSSLADNWADNLNDAKRKAHADARPVVAVLDLLIEREKLFKPDGTVDAAALKKIDDQIDAKMKDPAVKKDSSYKSASRMVLAARAMDDILAYGKRVIAPPIADAPGADRTAQMKARELAKGDPKHCYGVVDLGFKDGKKLGYQIIQYPVDAFVEKKSWAETPGTNLLQVTLYAGGVLEGGKLPINGPANAHFEPGKVDAAIAQKPLADADKQKIIDPIGKRAKELVAKQYAEVIRTYEGFRADGGKLLDFIAREAAGKSLGEIEILLKDMFGLNAYVSQGGKDSAPIVAIAVRNFLRDYAKLQAKKPPDEAGMATLKRNFLKSGDFATIKAGVEPRLKTLNKAAAKAAAMSNQDAAFKLLKEFPTIRQQIYRENGFRLDPQKGVPPYETKSDVEKMIQAKPPVFTSTAEMVFVQEAECWGNWETAAEIGETAAIVGGVLAISFATGGLGSGAATAIALGSAAAIGGYGIYKASAHLEKTTAEVVAGFKGHESLTAAETGVALAYMSAAVQVGMAGVSIVVGSAMQGAAPATGRAATLVSKIVGVDAKLVASELALTTLTTVIDPTTWQGNWKDVVVNIVVGGAITFVGLRVGASLNKMKNPPVSEGTQGHVVFDQAQKKAFLHRPNGDPIEIRPTGVTPDGKATFDYIDPVSKQTVVIEMQVTKAYTEAKPKLAASAGDPPDAPKAPVVDTPAVPAKEPAKVVKAPIDPPSERVYMDDDFLAEAGVKKVTPGEIVQMGDGKKYQVSSYSEKSGVVRLLPADTPSPGGAKVGDATPAPVKLTPDEFRRQATWEGWVPTDQPNVYKKPSGELVSVAIEKPRFSAQQVAGIEAEIAARKANIAKNPASPEAIKDKAIVEGLETLLKTGPTTELTHSTNSLMWEGLEKSKGRMLSGKKLTEEGIGRKTGEGDAFSGIGGEKTDVFFGYGEEGLGTSMGYYRLAAETEHYNIGRMSDADLAAEVAKVETIKTNYGKVKGAGGVDGVLGFDESRVTSRLKSLRDEVARRAKLPPELRAAPYPIMFGVDGQGLGIKHSPNSFNGIRSEAMIADAVDLRGSLRQVFVPADKIADARLRLDKIFGPGHGIQVIPFEALDVAIAGMPSTVDAHKFTVDGLKGNEQVQKMWYDMAYEKATGKKP